MLQNLVKNHGMLSYKEHCFILSWRYLKLFSNVVRCAIWYHLRNLKNVKKNPWWSLTLRKVTLACNFTKSNNFPSMGVFHGFLIVEIVSNHVKHLKY